ncbi:MAG: hypothetical protein V5A46_10040, partial [Haloferacaceae archaeon]
MVWVRSEYAGELAVISAWLAALLPWNVVVSERVFGGRFVFVRFPLFEVQYGWGHAIPELHGTVVRSLPTAFRLQAEEGVAAAYQAWSVAAAAVALAVAVSIAYYLLEERLEAGPVDPAGLIGGLLVVAGGAFSVAVGLFFTRG